MKRIDVSKIMYGNDVARPAAIPAKEWEANIVNNPARSWGLADLEDAMQTEPSAGLRRHIAFLRKYSNILKA